MTGSAWHVEKFGSFVGGFFTNDPASLLTVELQAYCAVGASDAATQRQWKKAGK